MSDEFSQAPDVVRAHVVVHGTVQGVAFRAYVRHHAQRLNLHGWVKNLPSGQVELEVEGGPDVVNVFLPFLHDGPSLAHVERVDVNWVAVMHDVTPFEIRR
ncbi:MAG: acylphosphatase [Nitrospirales bacterium]|nr:acylphosphatase [Nitrospira sp.]MDR4502500.1 acylphosphatase [Nitrospirales bacterium]